MAPKKMVQRPLSFQKEKKNEEQNTRTRNDEVDTTGVEVITIDDSSTTSDDPKRTDDSASSPLGGQNVDSVKTPFATMGHRKEEEDAKKKPVEEEKKGGEKRKKGGVVPKTKTSAEEMVMSSPDSAEKKRAERGKKAKGDDDDDDDDDDVDDDSDFKMVFSEKKAGMAGSKSGVSKAPAKTAVSAAVVAQKKTMKEPVIMTQKASIKTPSKGTVWIGKETKALIDIRFEVLTMCDSNCNSEQIRTSVLKKALKNKVLRGRAASNSYALSNRWESVKGTSMKPYVLGTITIQELKNKLGFERDEDVEAFVRLFQLEFALKVTNFKKAGREEDAVKARKYGEFNHREEKDRKKAATNFLVDRKAELAASNEGKKEESGILWYETIPARSVEQIIKHVYVVAEDTVEFEKKLTLWSCHCSALAELECEREEGMVKVFREANKAQTEYVEEEKAVENGNKMVDNLEKLDEARRNAKEISILYIWQFYMAASCDFMKAKHNLDVAWEMEKEDPKFDADNIPKEALKDMLLYKCMIETCRDEEDDELKISLFTSANLDEVTAAAVKNFNYMEQKYGELKESNPSVEVNELEECINSLENIKSGIERLKERNLPKRDREMSKKQ